MSKRLCVLLILGFVIGANDGKPSAKSKKDLDKMQGSWHAVAVEIKGVPRGDEEVKKFQLTVKKDAFRVKVDGKDHVSAKLVLRADKQPREMDLVLETGPVHKGIYEIDGDSLKICFNLSGPFGK